MRGLLLCLVLTSCSHWTKKDAALETLFIGTAAVDWRQTQAITAASREANPMLGPCGNEMRPNLYFPLAIVLHAAAAAVLPPPWREIFQSFTIGLEATTIFNNYQEGFEFH